MSKLNLMINILQPKKWTLSILILFIVTTLFWQNCSKVQLESIPEDSVIASGTEQSALKLPEIDVPAYRAVIILDMSNSMFSGACPSSFDTMVDNVVPSINCIGPTGVDPDGKRFMAVLKWIEDFQEKINKNRIKYEHVKFMIIPFSNPLIGTHWNLQTPQLSSIYQILTYLKLEKTIKTGFISLDDAKTHIQILWSMYSKYHDHPEDASIPRNILDAVQNKFNPRRDTKTINGSSGTSIVLPALIEMNANLQSELTNLKNQKTINNAHFEIAFLSDGVPKPHALHIERAVEYVWLNKKEVQDPELCGLGYEGSDGKSYCSYWVPVTGGSTCKKNCGEYLKKFIDMGTVQIPSSEKPACSEWYSIPFSCAKYANNVKSKWNGEMMCGPCFDLLNQFEMQKSACSGRNSSCYYNYDTFSKVIKDSWGDWTLNRHATIIEKLKATESIFKKQFPSAQMKMNFIRIDSENNSYATQPGELIKEINWFERSKDYFSKNHSFSVVKDKNQITSLFNELYIEKKYNLSMVYAYNRSARSQSNGTFKPDSDGDGLADDRESLWETLGHLQAHPHRRLA
ncbi:MAG TPA: hypothetical protein PLJ21_11465 [Pseudobdellovibrionaceae bacterium]|nr:hypothetical protein [Pseudobdellovibrionaceae bacterium]